MKSKELITLIQQLDPSGKKEILAEHEGWAYDLCNPHLAKVKKGVVDEGDREIVIPTLF